MHAIFHTDSPFSINAASTSRCVDLVVHQKKGFCHCMDRNTLHDVCFYCVFFDYLDNKWSSWIRISARCRLDQTPVLNLNELNDLIVNLLLIMAQRPL